MRAALDLFLTLNLSTVRFLPSKCADHDQWKDGEIEHCRSHFDGPNAVQNLATILNLITTRTELKKTAFSLHSRQSDRKCIFIKESGPPAQTKAAS